MTHGALLSTTGDPFSTSLVLKLWKQYWHDEVDAFYIDLNNHSGVPDYALSELFSNICKDPKIHFIYHPTGIGNGPPITEMVKIAKEDLLLLLEDDFFIFTKGLVSGYFRKIESGEIDLIGSPRYATGEVAEAAKRKYNLDYSGIGDKGFGWWPTGFYCKREDLLKTDLDFASTKYPKGQYFKELDHTFSEDMFTDTFTWASLQLRYLGLKSMDIPQYHSHPYDFDNGKLYLWEKPLLYIHAGSLSSGWGGYLTKQIPRVTTELETKEMETRVAFWQICMDNTDGYEEFKKEYAGGIDNLVTNTNLDRNRIDKKIKMYKELMKL